MMILDAAYGDNDFIESIILLDENSNQIDSMECNNREELLEKIKELLNENDLTITDVIIPEEIVKLLPPIFN